MNKQEYLKQLENELRNLPKLERDEIINDYTEHFDEGISDGREEEEIAISLGNPKMIARDLKADYRITVAKNDSTFPNVMRAIFATLGLGFFNLIFVLGPLIGILGTLFGLIVAAISIFLSGIAVIIGAFLQPIYPEWISLPNNIFVSILIGIGLISLGIVFFLILKVISEVFIKLMIKYLTINLNIIMNRREKHEDNL